jgi:CheY-like chemotaxis protein
MTATILVVEDEPEIRELIAASLAVEGYQVLCAGDGLDALQQLDDHPEVDLLFTDIIMPGELHGYDLARQARQRKPGIKLLYTSGYALSAALRVSAPIEAAKLVPKPFKLDQLIGEIRRALAA